MFADRDRYLSSNSAIHCIYTYTYVYIYYAVFNMAERVQARYILVAFVCRAIMLPRFTVVVFLEFAVYCSGSAVFFQATAGLMARG